MIYRKVYETTAEMARWYDAKYTGLGGTWMEEPSTLNQRLDEMGVPAQVGVEPFSNQRFLDVGCGGGHMLQQALLRGLICYGLEISEVAVRYAAKLAPEAVICPVSVEVAAGIGTFDYIYSGGSLEHVIDIDEGLRTIHRMLKPDGVWYFLLPTLGWTHEDQPNERLASAEEWIEVLATHGLMATQHTLIGDALVTIMGGKR